MRQLEKAAPLSRENAIMEQGKFNFQLPLDITEYLIKCNGVTVEGEGDYFLIWPIEEWLSSNEMYEVTEFAPSFFLIGSDGGGTAYCINRRTGSICKMPFVGMNDSASEHVAASFFELIPELLG